MYTGCRRRRSALLGARGRALRSDLLRRPLGDGCLLRGLTRRARGRCGGCHLSLDRTRSAGERAAALLQQLAERLLVRLAQLPVEQLFDLEDLLVGAAEQSLA